VPLVAAPFAIRTAPPLKLRSDQYGHPARRLRSAISRAIASLPSLNITLLALPGGSLQLNLICKGVFWAAMASCDMSQHAPWAATGQLRSSRLPQRRTLPGIDAMPSVCTFFCVSLIMECSKGHDALLGSSDFSEHSLFNGRQYKW
jgi:hypothetical protein